jgi:hypothetical protein
MLPVTPAVPHPGHYCDQVISAISTWLSRPDDLHDVLDRIHGRPDAD